jgi:ABC-type nitrate/sulfonate/bicarbonate transport system substrate-binding protein
MSTADIKLVFLRIADAVAALASGKVDAVVGGQAEGDVDAPALGLVRGPSFSKLNPGFQIGFIAFSRRLLDDSDTGARFLAAYFDGVRAFRQGKTPRFMTDYALENHLDAGFVQKYCRDYFLLDGDVKVEHLSRFADWAHRRQFVPVIPDMSAIVDTTVLKKAKALSRARGSRP